MAPAGRDDVAQPGKRSQARLGHKGWQGMRSGRIWWLAAAGAAVVAAGWCLAVWPAGRGPALVPDPARARAMMPAIIAYLDSPAYRQDGLGGYSASDYQAGRVRWLCGAALVEVRPDGGRWRAGIDVACGDYDRRGGTMREEDGGDMGHVVMVLSGGGRYQVLSAAQEPGITPDPAWIDQHFSARAAAEVNSGQGPTAPMPDTRALLAFGCAPGAKGSHDTQSAEAWPCRPA